MQPKVGMHFSDVRKRVIRLNRFAPASEGKDRLIGSLLNQAQLHEGDGAKNEIKAEVSAIEKKASLFSGAGPKQLGACMEFSCENRDKLCNMCYKKDKLVLGSQQNPVGSATLKTLEKEGNNA